MADNPGMDAGVLSRLLSLLGVLLLSFPPETAIPQPTQRHISLVGQTKRRKD